jgi:hypothetical protein
LVAVVVLFKVINVVCAVAVNCTSNIAPALKSVTVNVVFKFCVPSAAVPTCTFKAAPVPLESNTLTCKL